MARRFAQHANDQPYDIRARVDTDHQTIITTLYTTTTPTHITARQPSNSGLRCKASPCSSTRTQVSLHVPECNLVSLNNVRAWGAANRCMTVHTSSLGRGRVELRQLVKHIAFRLVFLELVHGPISVGEHYVFVNFAAWKSIKFLAQEMVNPGCCGIPHCPRLWVLWAKCPPVNTEQNPVG